MKPCIIIGADGGGTKTNFLALNAATGEQIAQSTTGGTNRFAVGIDETVRRIQDGIAALKLPAHLPLGALALGDPAMDDESPEDAKELRERLQAALQIPVFSQSDVFMALFALTEGAPGALLIAGTGSMGVALTRPYQANEPPALVTVGGWGYPSTDGGSGYSIAVKGITAAFDAFDGIAPPTALCQAVLESFDCRHPRELINRFNGSSLSKSQIAAFAVQVNRCAEEGDARAQEILAQAAQRLSGYALSLLRSLPENRRHLGLFGSVFVKNHALRQEVEQAVGKQYPDAIVEIPARPPEWGAVQYAIQNLGGNL